MTTLPNYFPFYGGGQVNNPSNVIGTNGTPNETVLTQNRIGTLAVDNTNATIYGLSSKYGGTDIWATLGSNSSGYSITPYIVGPIGFGRYQTIQSAVDAATINGGGTVYIQPGTYEEDVSIGNLINLTGYPGENGAVTVLLASGIVPSVIVNGSITIDTSSDQLNTYNAISNIYFNATDADVLTFNSNPNYNSAASIIGCTLNVNTSGYSALSLSGFPVINLIQCSLSETSSNTGNLLTIPGSEGFKFGNINAFGTFFALNKSIPCELQDGSRVVLYLSNCRYSSMIDISGATDALLTIDAFECSFSWAGESENCLISFGDQAGSISVFNSRYLSGTGGFSSSTSETSDSFSVITNTYFTSTLHLTSTCNDIYYNCIFSTSSSSSIEMESSTEVSLSQCSINSSNINAISGSGSGTLNLCCINFLDSNSIQDTVTTTWQDTYTGSLFVTGDMSLQEIGNKIIIPTGSNASIGTTDAMSGTPGSVSVSTTACSTTAKIFYSRAATGGTTGNVSITAQSSSGFTLTSTGNETSTFNWWIIND